MANNVDKKLVLFDIDGTLIQHVGPKGTVGYPRFIYAIKKTFGVDVIILPVNYNGWVDQQIAWDIVRRYGISRDKFLGYTKEFFSAMEEFAKLQEKERSQLYVPIVFSITLAKLLAKTEQIYLGLLTGNVERMAWWKLTHAGITDIFHWGIFSDGYEDRITLAKTVYDKAYEYFHLRFVPDEVYVVGDAVGDVRCGKAIGAKTIITLTGGHSKKELRRENPDLLVENLMDPRVLELFHLSNK